MNASAVEAPLVAAPDLAGLEPVEKIKRRWPMVLGAALTLLMIAALGRELFDSGLRGLSRALPTNPLFYLAFALYYLGPPTFDFIIFRRLWQIPLSGMAALHKKRISNEVLFGYSGEAYFYAWARQRTHMVAAPFGAVKDVTILSAVAGNGVTLLGVTLALPFCYNLLTAVQQKVVLGSLGLIIAMSLPVMIFSRRLFSLPPPELWRIFAIHCVRLISGSLFIAFAWHAAMPGVSLTMWLFLAAARLLAWRLPLVPNKELVFATFAIMLIGQGEALSDLMALIAAMSLLVHVALIAGFSIQSLLARKSIA